MVSSFSVAFASVGVSDGNAASPTSGASVFGLTTMLPTAWIFRPPTGSASTQYVPGLSMSRCETNTACGSPGSFPFTPIGSDVAVVCANGAAFSSLASQTLAVGRVTTRPCPSMTRNVNRTVPGPKSAVPGTIATSSPGARQSASSVWPFSDVVVVSDVEAPGPSCAEEEPPQPAAMEQAARTRAAA